MKSDQKKDAVLSDEEIISLYWERNEQAIAETDRKYGHYLFTIANNILNDRLDCEECVNDTYLGTWNRIPPARPSIFHVFLSRIVRNIAIDKHRANTAQKRIPTEMTVSLSELEGTLLQSPSVEEEVAVEELGRILNDFMSGLSERDEMIFFCRYYYADKISSIAYMLGVSESTVKRDLARIRDDLQKKLEKEGYNV